MATSRLSSRSLSVLCRATTTTTPASATVCRRFASALRFSSAAVVARPSSRVVHGGLVHARLAASRNFTTTSVVLDESAKETTPGPDLVTLSRQWSFEEMVELANGSGKETVIIDVREPVELFETGIIPHAVNIPITTAVQSFHMTDEDFREVYGWDRPAKDVPLVFYCKAGVRAQGAATLAKRAGWKEVGEYKGSWLEWAEKGGPVERVQRDD